VCGDPCRRRSPQVSKKKIFILDHWPADGHTELFSSPKFTLFRGVAKRDSKNSRRIQLVVAENIPSRRHETLLVPEFDRGVKNCGSGAAKTIGTKSVVLHLNS